jgi:hypothetical protein
MIVKPELIIVREDFTHQGDHAMADPNATPAELVERIQNAEENLRDLVEQATAYSGGNDEERSSDRIAAQQEDLDALKRQRDALS